VLIPKLYDGRTAPSLDHARKRPRRARPAREARVPTDLERQGDFSRTLNGAAAVSIYDPATTTSRRKAARHVCGGRIPAARINPAGQAWLNLLPNRHAPATRNWNCTTGTLQYLQVEQTQVSARIDHNISSGNAVGASACCGDSSPTR